MAAILNYQNRGGRVLGKQLFNPVFQSHSQTPSILRCYCSQRTKNHDEIDEHDHSDKPKSSTKTKRAKAMARIINSQAWSDGIESSLASISPSLSKTTVIETLNYVKDPSKALKFFKWVQETGFTHDGQSYFMMLEILGRSRSLNSARNFLFSIEKGSRGAVKLEARFFNSLIRNYSRAGLFQESIKLFKTMKSLGISPSVISFNSLLSIMLKRGRTNMAKNLYDEMRGTYGVTPDTYTFNTLIRGFCMNGMVDEGFRFFKEMSSFSCDPDVITYNTLVDGLCRGGKVGIAHNVVRGMSKKRADLNPNVVTFTTLIRGFCSKQEIDEALAVFEEMVNKGIKPNKITYNTLIKGLSEVQKFEKIKEILEEAAGNGGFTPDICTFNTLMHAHCNAGNLDEALKVFEKMTELKVQPDSATYSVLIRNLCQRGNYDKAEALFDDLMESEILLKDDGCKPLVAAYNPMFEYLCGNGKTEKAERVFRQLMKKGTQDPPSYKTLIMGHCMEGSYESGFELLVLMLRRDFVPDVEMYESLIDGLLQKGIPLLAQQTLEKMLKSALLPKSSTFHSILANLLEKECPSESANLVQLMLDRKIRQNITFSTHCMKLLFGAGMRERAFQIVGMLYDNGYSVKMDELIGYLCQHKRLLEANNLLLFTLEKHHSVDIEMCNKVIPGLCKINKLSEAFSLYYALVEKGVHQQLACQDILKVSLETGEKRNEAEFVSKRMQQQPELEKSSLQLGSGKSRIKQRGQVLEGPR